MNVKKERELINIAYGDLDLSLQSNVLKAITRLEELRRAIAAHKNEWGFWRRFRAIRDYLYLKKHLKGIIDKWQRKASLN